MNINANAPNVFNAANLPLAEANMVGLLNRCGISLQDEVHQIMIREGILTLNDLCGITEAMI